MPRLRATRRALIALCVLAVVVWAASALADGDRHHRPRVPSFAADVTVGAPAPAAPIPAGFLGLSLEYQGTAEYIGPSTDPNRVFAQLVRNLAPGQQPVLRIGGDSTDHTWWPLPGIHNHGLTYALTPAWIKRARWLTRSLDARLILGIDLEANSPRIAGAEARHLLDGIGRQYVQGLELGNEPGLYGSFPWYTFQGDAVRGRPRGYGLPQYLQDVQTMSRSLPDVPLVGPAVGAPTWLRSLPELVRALPQISEISYHRYPMTCWGKPGEPTHPSIANLLGSTASRGLAASVAPLAKQAQAAGRPLRVDELNTVACGGTKGVSDTFASALWALDTSFAMARAGVAGINVHTFPSARYGLFTFTRSGGHWTGHVAPEYYGLLMFAQAAPPGSRLLDTSVTGSRAADVRAWATTGGSGAAASGAAGSVTHVVLINDDPTHAAQLSLRIPGATAGGTVTRLRAPRAGATSGVTYGGSSFGATTTGRLPAPRQLGRLAPSAAGRYSVRLPPASAALLTLRG